MSGFTKRLAGRSSSNTLDLNGGRHCANLQYRIIEYDGEKRPINSSTKTASTFHLRRDISGVRGRRRMHRVNGEEGATEADTNGNYEDNSAQQRGGNGKGRRNHKPSEYETRLGLLEAECERHGHSLQVEDEETLNYLARRAGLSNPSVVESARVFDGAVHEDNGHGSKYDQGYFSAVLFGGNGDVLRILEAEKQSRSKLSRTLCGLLYPYF